MIPLFDFEGLRREIEELERHQAKGRAVGRALEQLTSALEELHTAGEELETKNEELARAVVDLEREHERYRQMFDLLPDACLVTDADAYIVDVNARACDLLGLERPALLEAFIAQAFASSAGHEVRALARRRSGTATVHDRSRVLEVRAIPLAHPASRMVTAWVVRDTGVEFEGEDLGTRSVEVARSWLTVYAELINLTEQALETVEAADGARHREGVDREALHARLARLQHRRRAWRDRHAELAGLRVDRDRRVLSVGLAEVQLTRREQQLLSFLLQHPNISFSAEALLNRAWLASFLSPEQLRTYVGRLRRKLEQVGAGCRLENVRGTGYRLVFDPLQEAHGAPTR